MNYVTHNQEDVWIDGSHLQGHIKAEYRELLNLFGVPHDSDGYKSDAEWNVRFADGTVANIYNWKDGKNYCGEQGTPTEKITDWHIGGVSTKAVDQVQIALDLYRESKDKEPEDKAEAAFQTAYDMMQTIRSNRGEDYADAVEVTLLMRKQNDLFCHILTGMVVNEVLTERDARSLQEINSMVAAKVISKIAKRAVESTESAAKELMGWAERLAEYEDRGANEIVSRMTKGRK